MTGMTVQLVVIFCYFVVVVGSGRSLEIMDGPQGKRQPRNGRGRTITCVPCSFSNGILNKLRMLVIAKGLQRFAPDRCPPQPDWEQLSDRVICILGYQRRVTWMAVDLSALLTC